MSKKKIKILYVIYSICIGGGETQLLKILENIDYDRYELFLACSKGEFYDLVKNLKNVRFYNIDFKSKFSFKAILELKDIIEENSIDIVHSHLLRSTLNSRFAKLFSNLPVILITNLHNSLIRANVGWFQKYSNLIIDSITGRLDDMAITVSNSLKDDLVKYERYNDNKVTTIYNGVALDDYTESEPLLRKELNLTGKDILVGYVGRLHEQKGLQYFLESIPLILKKCAEYAITFVIVGDGPLKDYLVGLSREYGIENCIRFTGFRDDIPDILNSFDIMVSPSIYEGLPVTLIEASAGQKPIVTTDIAGNNEVVLDNETGYLVPVKSGFAIAESVCDLIIDEQKRIEMGRKGRDRVKKLFDIRQTVTQLDKLYVKLLADRSY